MKNFSKLFGIIIFIAIIGFLVVACGGGRDPALVGTWFPLEADRGANRVVYGFHKNGNVIIDADEFNSYEGIKWETKNNRLSIISGRDDPQPQTWDYEISGTRLILSANGSERSYARFPSESSSIIVGTWTDTQGKEWVFDSNHRLIFATIFGGYRYIFDDNKLCIDMEPRGFQIFDASISADGRTLNLTGGNKLYDGDDFMGASGPGWSENILKKSQ